MGRHRVKPYAKDPAFVYEVLMYAAGWSLDRLGVAPRWLHLARGARLPAFSAAVIAPLVLATAGGASPRSPEHTATVRDTAVAPMAAVTPTFGDPSGPAIVAAARPLAEVHVAAAQPPTSVVNHVDALGIPPIALSAYRNAERIMAASAPGCGLSWSLLAGIGRIESMHAHGGATDGRGTAVRPIYGPVLDGTLPGNEVIVQSSAAGRVSYARAVGPMQFLPDTWARYGADGDEDGVADPQNLYDSTLAAARYLCSGGQDLREPLQAISAVLRYNKSMPYARNVLGWADAYATGVVPIDLPPLTGTAPRLAETHLENPKGLGPGLPLRVDDLASPDRPAVTPLIELGLSEEQTDLLAQNFELPEADSSVATAESVAVESEGDQEHREPAGPPPPAAGAAG